jgi:hypothetical protein
MVISVQGMREYRCPLCPVKLQNSDAHAVEKLTEHINTMHSAFTAVPVRYAVEGAKVSTHTAILR